MNKKLLTAIMTMLIIILLTSGCSAKMSREEYFAALIAQGENFGAVYSDFAAPLSTIDTYSYTLTTYSEYLANFDYGQRLMPTEYKKWEKINQTLTYIKAGNLEYYKNEIIQPVYDGDNMPVFSDAKCKNPIFADKITFELWLTDGSTTNVKINGTAVTDIENYSVSDFYIVNFDNQPAALFSSNTRNWFGKKLNTAQYYYVKALESTENIPYSLSGNATGYAEDLTFDWQSISNVLI
ncbi:MAG: hypothetical protein EOM87_07510, partial [Clostridia bacterium]|nr:hypothetical protein [Clostridia bacterium]